jgi:hypothetical protein
MFQKFTSKNIQVGVLCIYLRHIIHLATTTSLREEPNNTTVLLHKQIMSDFINTEDASILLYPYVFLILVLLKLKVKEEMDPSLYFIMKEAMYLHEVLEVHIHIF